MSSKLAAVLHLPVRCPICMGLVKPAQLVEDPFAGQICRDCANGSRLLRVLKGEEEP